MQKRVTLPQNLNHMSDAELTRWIGSAAKRNNERLRSLEREGMEKSSAAYRYVRRQEYDGNVFYGRTKNGELKFKTSLKGLSFAEKKSYAFELLEFQNARSSTISGMHEIEEKSAQTFAENFGDKGISYKEFSEAMSSSIMKSLYDMYGSDVVVELAERVRGMSVDEIAEALGDYSQKTLSEILKDIDDFQKSKQEIGGDGGLTFGNTIPL